jgi:FkbM family methyltransferase
MAERSPSFGSNVPEEVSVEGQRFTNSEAEKNSLRREIDSLKQQLEHARAEREALIEEVGRYKQEVARSTALATELSAAHDALLQSTSWRLTEPMRSLLRRLPGLHAYLRGGLLNRSWKQESGPRGYPVLSGPSHDMVTVPAAANDRVLGEAGHWIYVDPADTRAQQLIAARGSLNPPTLVAWRILMAETEWTHILDVGANYGEMLVNVLLPRGAGVIAVEPNPVIRAKLARTLDEAGISAQILEAAFSNSEGTGRLRVHDTWSGMSRLARPDDAVGIPVPITTLGAALRGMRVPLSRASALIKIDVEGDEADVLRGGMEELSALQGFAALVEVVCASSDDLAWIEQRFDIEMLRLGGPAKLVPVSRGQFADMLANDTFYHQDVVLRPRR